MTRALPGELPITGDIVTSAPDRVKAARPPLGRGHSGPRRGEHTNSAHRLTIEATADM